MGFGAEDRIPPPCEAVMIIAHHIILTGYGHWLPNDPRGSLSREFRSPGLEALGAIHFGRRSSQPSGEQIRSFYEAAAGRLKYPVVWFDGAKRQAIAEAFGRIVWTEKLTCYACAVMRNHAHLLIRRHRLRAQEMIGILKDGSREALVEKGLVPPSHPVWSEDPYVAYKDTTRAVRAAICYVNANFRKHRIPAQSWAFVVPYDDWPFHRRRKPTS